MKLEAKRKAGPQSPELGTGSAVRIPVSSVPEGFDRTNTIATGILAASLAAPLLAIFFASSIGPAVGWVA